MAAMSAWATPLMARRRGAKPVATARGAVRTVRCCRGVALIPEATATALRRPALATAPEPLGRGTTVPARRRGVVASATAAAASEPHAVPEHIEALNMLYYGYGLLSGLERTFRFGVPLILATITHSFRPIALLGLTGQLSMFILGPIAGAFLDSHDRLAALNTVVVTQTVSILLAALGVLMMVQGGAVPTSTVDLFRSPAFLLLVFGHIGERLSALASDVATERDWIPLLVGPGRDEALAVGNATFRRLDLMMECTGPLAFGWVLTTWGAKAVLQIDVMITLAVTPVVMFCFFRCAILAGGALARPLSKPPTPDMPPPSRQTTALPAGLPTASRAQAAVAALRRSLGEVSSGWRLYLAQPVLPASVAYFLLYFNAALSPGGLLTALLTHQGLDGTLTAGFRTVCALMGFVATFGASRLIAARGPVRAGGIALTFQAAVLAVACAMYFGLLARSAPGTAPLALAVFCGCVALSRLGLWCFDMAETQLFQMTVPPEEAGSVNTTELSLCSLAELIMLSAAAVVEDPSQFGLLAAASAGAVAVSWAIYAAWEASLKEPARAKAVPA